MQAVSLMQNEIQKENVFLNDFEGLIDTENLNKKLQVRRNIGIRATFNSYAGLHYILTEIANHLEGLF